MDELRFAQMRGMILSFPFYAVVKIPKGSSFYAGSIPVK